MKKNETENQNRRPPVVVVMGHIDHGKTKILDWYRQTKVVEEESGGITQHIGAYEVEHNGKRVTFIDTPGHEAFSKMRSRGARVADLAILVVAAEEGVKPQTKEAIEIIKENKLPFVVALNKIDRPEANPERVKQDLAKEEVLVESYGGKIPAVEVSAKTGQGMEELLEVLLLASELEELSANPEKLAEGVVIEAHRDPKRGVTSTLLVRDGTLKKQNVLVVGRSVETIKILEDFRGQPASEVLPSSPVLVSGLSQMPAVGDSFRAFGNRGAAEKYVQALPEEEIKAKPIYLHVEGEEKPIFNIILKADVAGSKEVLEEELKKIQSDAVGINIIRSEVGDVNESDAKLAIATKLVTIIGFKVKIDASARDLIKDANIHTVMGEIIYEVLDEVKKRITEIIPPEIKRVDIGRAKILKLFKKDGNKQIVGGRIEEGAIRKETPVEIQRDKNIVGGGRILQLQHNKVDVAEVEKGSEFGALIDSPLTIQEGDVLIIYTEETTQRAV
ncbi:MAG: translation initiation factor IF-2 [Candidatus Sungiibacteriota bacterium]|uniref:Translation initiation factor IF-2 n=1 Tax=Candidatus Sungiibacteriota bacterium TaxID=2750080 RepID=A0A7T5RK14_9BACT|nr:MAG: translation initiation factor IF-2 [Candidatus Sungbacteria bacterium]